MWSPAFVCLSVSKITQKRQLTWVVLDKQLLLLLRSIICSAQGMGNIPYLHISRSAYKSTPVFVVEITTKTQEPCVSRLLPPPNRRPKSILWRLAYSSFSSTHLYITIVSYGLKFDREPVCTDFVSWMNAVWPTAVYTTSAFKIVCR